MRRSSPNKNLNPVQGFTLIEMLVVVAIIALLISMISVAVGSSLKRAQKTACASNLRQWGTALMSFATDNQGEFPDNSTGADVSWIAGEAVEFSNAYLEPLEVDNVNRAGRGERTVHYCPTQKWHTYNASFGPGWGPYGAMQLIGYFYLPGRRQLSPFTGCNYSPAGEKWVTRHRFGMVPAQVPLMSDMIQNNGGSWIHAPTSLPYSSHATGRDGEPEGGHFLYEDGHVRWLNLEQVDLGATLGDWNFLYRPTD